MTDDDLRNWLRFLGIEDCTCPNEWRADIGHLYGISMGAGWVRVTTAADCPHHGAQP